jgi:hypothetical protein
MFFEKLYVFYLPLFDKRSNWIHKHTLSRSIRQPLFSVPMKAATPSPYAHIIIKATGATGDDVIIIENIMREEVFHSTLDLQTAGQLATAAQAAQTMLRGDYEFHHLELSDCRLALEESKLEQSLNQTTPGGPPVLSLRYELDSVRRSFCTTRQSLNCFFDQAFCPN